MNATPCATARFPIILLIDGDTQALARTAEALRRRFDDDYEVMTATTAEAGMELLRQFAESGAELALLCAALRLPDGDGPSFLEDARPMHPQAGRALMIEMGDVTASETIRVAMARCQADFWITGGWESPEEWLYPLVQQALSSWSSAHRPRHEHVRIVGDQWASRSHELRDRMTRNMVPYGFYDTGSPDGQRLIAEHSVRDDQLPAMILFDGRVLPRPTDAQVAEALGVRTRPEPGVYDVVVLGAGPAGLAAAVNAASEGLRTVVIEPGTIGGQAGSSSMIRNYPGFPRGISGNELTYRSFEQATLLGAQFVFSNPAVGIDIDSSRRIVRLSNGDEIETRSIVIATGVSYRRLDIPEMNGLIGAGVFYGAAASEAIGMTGKRVCVIGGANSAGQAALHLARYANHVTIMVRGASLEASMSDYLIREIAGTPNITVRTGTTVVGARGSDRLEALTIEDADTGSSETVEMDGAFVMIGAVPRTDWLGDVVQRDEAGYIQTGTDASFGAGASRQPMLLETGTPGIFAAGDVRSGSLKRVASAVGDGGVVIGLVHRYLAEAAGVAGPV
jgi:thioredoxin reductase (NADPH)